MWLSLETIDHEGHEGTRKETLKNRAFVILRVLRGFHFGFHELPP